MVPVQLGAAYAGTALRLPRAYHPPRLAPRISQRSLWTAQSHCSISEGSPAAPGRSGSGCNHSVDSGPHSPSQTWARTIHRAYPNLDGIAYRGRFAGKLCVALFEHTANAFPTNPALSLPIFHLGLARRIDSAAMKLEYRVI
nr:RES domain-containing protein [Rhodococcus wratislaviensis]GLK36916.1 hypothetical protein GCM10017611_37750 [Rhodococcus wratislaviensis]